MRFLITVMLCAFVASPAMAKSKTASPAKPSAFTGELLSFQALLKLPKAKRMKYIRDVADMLATMESFNNRYTVAERSQLREFREQVAQLIKSINLLPEAYADEWDDVAPPEELGKIIPAWNGIGWVCGTDKAVFDYVLGTCMAKNQSGTTGFIPRNQPLIGGQHCPAQTVQVPHYRPELVACVPDASWARVPAERKSAIEAKTFEKPPVLRAKSYEEQRATILGAEAGTPEIAAGPAENTRGITIQPAAPPPPAPPGGADAGGESTPPPPPPPAVAIGATGPAAVPPRATNPETCSPPVLACKSLDPQKREELIRRWRSSENYQGVDSNVCIAGGFASKYKSSKKEPGTCDIKRDLEEEGIKGIRKCKQDEALCNPVLFCIATKNQDNVDEPVTFCVKIPNGQGKNRAITDACAAHYQKVIDKQASALDCADLDRKKLGAAEYKKQCDANKKTVGKACDPAYLPPDAKMAEIWKKMQDGVRKLRDVWCGKEDFAALFCRECEIISDKIYAMNKEVANNGCPPPVAPAPAAVPEGTGDPRDGQEAQGLRERRDR